MPSRARQLLAAASLLAACGGRYASVDGGDGGSSSVGGSTGSGGSGQAGRAPGGKAGSVTVGGSVGVAGSGTAGTAVGGGASKCGPPCPDVECAAGSYYRLNPDGCCGQCVPLDCHLITCPSLACVPGTQVVYPPDQCCPVCVPTDCDVRRRTYFTLRDETIEKYNSLGCMRDSDCTLLYEGTACEAICGVPVPSFYAEEIARTLESYASMACASCPPLANPSCPVQPPPACVNGRCQQRPL